MSRCRCLLFSPHRADYKPTCDTGHHTHPGNELIRGGERKETQRGVRSGGGDTLQHQTDYFSDSGGTKIRGRARAGGKQEVPKKEGRRQGTPTGEVGRGARKMLLGKQQEGSEVLQNSLCTLGRAGETDKLNLSSNKKTKNPSLPSGGGDLVIVFFTVSHICF